MSRAGDDEIVLSEPERAFVERVRDAYGPPARTPVQAAAFDARLRERLEERSGRGRLLVGFALAAAAAAAVVLALSVRAPVEVGDPVVAATDPPAEVVVETSGSAEEALMALTFETESLTETSTDRDESLPDDYVAIESLLLGG